MSSSDQVFSGATDFGARVPCRGSRPAHRRTLDSTAALCPLDGRSTHPAPPAPHHPDATTPNTYKHDQMFPEISPRGGEPLL